MKFSHYLIMCEMLISANFKKRLRVCIFFCFVQVRFICVSYFLCWQGVNDKLKILKKELNGGDVGALAKIRSTVLELVEPPQLVRPSMLPSFPFYFLDFLPTLLPVALKRTFKIISGPGHSRKNHVPPYISSNLYNLRLLPFLLTVTDADSCSLRK